MVILSQEFHGQGIGPQPVGRRISQHKAQWHMIFMLPKHLESILFHPEVYTWWFRNDVPVAGFTEFFAEANSQMGEDSLYANAKPSVMHTFF